MSSPTQHHEAGRRRTILLVGLLAIATIAVVATPARSQLTDVTLSAGGTLHLQGSDGDDTVTLRYVPGKVDPTKTFIEVEDPDGVLEEPEGCFRNTSTSIHCPVELVKGLEIDLISGNDILTVEGDLAEDIEADGGLGNDDLGGGDGRDQLKGGPGRDHLNGGKGPDRREGDEGNDVLEASPGNDTQRGGAGNDKLFGGPGNDRQNGGPGKDVLNGGGGNDKPNGGSGMDRCNGGPGNENPISCEIGYSY